MLCKNVKTAIAGILALAFSVCEANAQSNQFSRYMTPDQFGISQFDIHDCGSVVLRLADQRASVLASVDTSERDEERPYSSETTFRLVLAGYLMDSECGNQSNDPGAIQHYLRGCELGVAIFKAYACFRAGRMYRDGRGVARNSGEAVRLFHLSCHPLSVSSNGNQFRGPACLSLGEMYEAGIGVERNQDTAARMMRAFCNQYRDPACNRRMEMNVH